MKSQKSIGTTIASGAILPVIVPVLILTAMMGTAGMSRVMDGGRAKSQTITHAELNSTEQTFLDYQAIVNTIAQRDDKSVIASLESLTKAPISIDGDLFSNASLKSTTPTILVINLGKQLKRRAHLATEAGDLKVAEQYSNLIADLGDRLLVGSTPSVKSIQLAHDMHSFSLESRIDLIGKVNYATMVAYQRKALDSFWSRHISPKLMAHMPESDPRVESRFAEQILREYRDAWSRIRSGEV